MLPWYVSACVPQNVLYCAIHHESQLPAAFQRESDQRYFALSELSAVGCGLVKMNQDEGGDGNSEDNNSKKHLDKKKVSHLLHKLISSKFCHRHFFRTGKNLRNFLVTILKKCI